MNRETQMKLLYQQEQLPIFQNRMYDTEAEAKACPAGNMQLVEDQRTGLVYNAAFRPELMVYDAFYQNEQALSPLFQEHLESVSRIIDKCMGRDSIVEVGCGKGFFLEMLLAKGFDVTGFDPTYEGNSPKIMKHYFEPGVGIKATGLVLRHVLEHIHDPFNFLLQLRKANGGSGKIYIEVPCFDWICEHRAWFDIFYEHVNYFRISDFYRMFGTVIESGRLFGGQYLFVVAELATLRSPEISLKDCVNFPKGFTHHLDEPSRAKPSRHLGRRFKRCHLCTAQSPQKSTCQHCYRHQSGKTGQISAINRIIGSISHESFGYLAKGVDDLHYEFKLSTGN